MSVPPATDGAGIDAVVAVDWSGALTGSERKLWLCEVAGGTVVRLEAGRTRDALITNVIATAERTPRLAAGFDFAFSLPEWFFRARALPDAHALWALAAREGEEWIRGPIAPFWGRGGTRRPDLPAHVRRTELAAGERAARPPSSVFKLVGADQVGAGSVRGMPALARLAAAGFAIWPFDDPRPGRPVAVEIWPRLLYAERVVKSDPGKRAEYLERYAAGVGREFRRAAVASDDAFDALTAGLAMWDGRDGLAGLPLARGGREREEGRIWGTG